MKFPTISAGEFFELLRPAAFLLSVGLSIWVLASSRRRRFPLYIGLPWAVGTFLLPFVVLPLFIIVLIFRHLTQRSPQRAHAAGSEPLTEPQASPLKHSFLLLFVYGVLLLGATPVYFYRDYVSVDAHLARAVQAKLSSQSATTIREYRAALSLEDNPHTHKLLGVELAEAGRWPEALHEFRLAERGGESDEYLPFRIAQALSAQGDRFESVIEYQRFLGSHACTQALPDERCGSARQGIEEQGR